MTVDKDFNLMRIKPRLNTSWKRKNNMSESTMALYQSGENKIPLFFDGDKF
jgi:hypothetical protein